MTAAPGRAAPRGGRAGPLVVLAVAVTSSSSARAYDQRVGLQLAFLEQATHCGEGRFLRWDVGAPPAAGPRVEVSSLRYVHDATTDAVVGVGRAASPAGCFAAVRGSTIGPNQISDAQFWFADFEREDCSGCKVDFGFKTSYESVRQRVLDALEGLGCRHRPLHLVGHSLGAAVATYLLYDALAGGYKVAHAYAMESPRPGNEAFASALARKLDGAVGGTDAWRIAHYRDAVVHLPPNFLTPYAHALQEIYYSEENGLEYEECGVEDGLQCSGQWWPWQWTIQDHCWFADVNPCKCAAGEESPGLTLLVE